ncbi:MAG: hypothetical protein KGY74_09310 [Candidatus Cloacimonetes bacterium]|nr:hypothetical protein [Candidatus Cloacimonadota bacterium]
MTKTNNNRKFSHKLKLCSPRIEYFKIFAPYVTGSMYDNVLINIGKSSIGKNSQPKNISSTYFF